MKMRSRHQLCVINKQAQHVPVWGLRFKANPKPALRAKHLPMAVSKQIQARRTSLSLQVGTGLSAFCVWAIAGKKKNCHGKASFFTMAGRRCDREKHV